MYREKIINDSKVIISRHSDLFKNLNGKSILITGSTGFIGRHILFTLLELSNNFDIKKIICPVRDINKFERIFKDYVNYDNLYYFEYNLGDDIDCDYNIDYLIHGASPTDSSFFYNSPVDTIKNSIYGTDKLLDFAVNKNVKSMVYLSSLEVYGINNQEIIKEIDYGFIDILNPRSSYSESKKMSETLCSSYAKQYNLPVKIARLCQVFGPGVSKSDNRVYAQFAKSVVNKEDIILHTTGETSRNYCYTADAVSAIFYVLLLGENGEAYNIANDNIYISIRELAEKFSEFSRKSVIVRIDEKNNLIYNPIIKINLNVEKIKKIGWYPLFDLSIMIENLIKGIEN